MPWLWRPLWGAVWLDDGRAGGKYGVPPRGKEVPGNTTGEGEQQVRNKQGAPKWSGCLLYNPYQAGDRLPQEEREPEVYGPVGDDVGDDHEEKAERVRETGSGDGNLKHQDAANLETSVPTGQAVDSLSRQFEEVGPGVFQLKRLSPGKRADGSDSGTGMRQSVRVDAAWYRSALPSVIEGYRKVGQTRDGLPVYTFK